MTLPGHRFDNAVIYADLVWGTEFNEASCSLDKIISPSKI